MVFKIIFQIPHSPQIPLKTKQNKTSLRLHSYFKYYDKISPEDAFSLKQL